MPSRGLQEKALKGFIIFLCAITGGGVAAYGALTHGPIPGLHVERSISSISFVEETEASPLVIETDEKSPLSLGGGDVGVPAEGKNEIKLHDLSIDPGKSAAAAQATDPVDAVEHPNSETQDPSNLQAARDVGVVGNAGADTGSPNSINLIDSSRYDAIRGKDCKIGLKEIGFRALSLRSGSFRDGDTLSWDESFAKNRRISMLYASKDPVVTVNALAFGKNGILEAALVTEKSSGKEGVIALFVEEKNVPLIPVK